MSCKEGGVEVNADKLQYMFLYWDQNAGRSRIVKTDKISLNIVEVFKYFVKISTKKSLLKKKLRAFWIQAMLAIGRRRMFCLQFVIQKLKD